MESTRNHVVCIPCPGQGHMNAMLKLAKILHSEGFFITFVNTEFHHRRILHHGGPSALDGLPDFRFATIPDGLPPSDDLDRNQDITSLVKSMRTAFSTPFARLLSSLNDPSSGVPRVRCVISDAYTSFTLAATAQLSIPNVFFCSLSACGFLGFFCFEELMERGIIPLKSAEDLTNGYLDTIVDWIPGSTKMRLRDLPSFLRTTNRDDIMLNFVTDETQNSLKASAVVINTFNELEGPVIEALSSILPPVYDVGPLFLLSRQISNGAAAAIGGLNLWKEDSSCIEWLDGKEPGSVLYINFGSLAVLTSEQLVEFAWGLADSGCEFLWVIRPDLVVGENSMVPKEFIDETGGRSFLTGWCPQEEVLSHAAIGGFLTHCGWNSTMESICVGLPMICWPFFADQQPNCKYACSEWGIGAKISEDVKRAEVEMLIREVMRGEKGKEMKKKVLELKERAVKAAAKPDGASWKNLERLVEDIIMKY